MPAVGLSRALYQQQNEKPDPGTDWVPNMAPRLIPAPMVMTNALDVLDDPLTSLLFSETTPAPGNGCVSASNVGAFEAPFLDVRVNPFPLASA